jgi:polyhydroxyalkanoate synthesis regulator phasin
MSIPKFTLRLAILPLLGTLVTAKALDYAVAQTEKSIVFDYAQITPQPEPAEKPVPVPTSEPTPAPQATPEPTSSQKTQAEEAAPTPASKPASVEAPLPTEGATTPTGNVTINLINKLVKRGILDAEEAKEMIRQAEVEAEAVRSQSQTDMVAIAQAAAVQVVAATTPVESGLPAASSDDIRVTHIPQPVKDQMKEEIKLELATDKVSNQLSSAVRLPKWVQDVKPFLDIRVRYEGDFFPTGNDNTGAFPNFNAINTGAPHDFTGNQFSPQLNVDQNRNQFKLRARFGADIAMADHFSSGFRIATGQNNSPTSTNQGMGTASSATQGQGGNFSKYAIWLDRAFLRYDSKYEDLMSATAWVGRFDNPFFYTPLIWDDDLGFDGVAATVKGNVTEGFQVFTTGGAFVVYNTDFNFSSNQPEKFSSYDKYLLGVQTGIDWKVADDWKAKVAAAYYSFYNIEGKLSTPYTPLTSSDAGNTDSSRPSFAQKGNTYMPIREILPDASNDNGAINQWQYYGLATKFNVLSLAGRLDYDGFEPVRVSLISEFVQNLAFNKSDINNIAVNNRGALDDNNLTEGDFDGSPYGWYGEFRVGTPALSKRWDWQLNLGYRWIGSDAVVDGFNDSDFGLGGTNMKGFTVGGILSLSENVSLGTRWMGADSIAGPQYHTNILYFEINSKF